MQLVDVETRGVDDDVRFRAQVGHELTFGADGVQQTTGPLHGVRAPDTLEPADERFVRRIEEDKDGAVWPGGQLIEQMGVLTGQPPGPGVDDDGQPGRRPSVCGWPGSFAQ